jgi:ribosomal protein L11 methyltransferase
VQLEGEWVTAFCLPGIRAEKCCRNLSRYCQSLQQLHPDLPELQVIQEDLATENWAEAWKAFFKPVHIGERIVVKPSWEPFEPSRGQVVIEIDPGRAFGTGNHPSTALCIEFLEKVLSSSSFGEADSSPSVLDVGTGSGILGIVAARLGAGRVLGLDIDPEAVEATTRNLNRNGVGNVMMVSARPLEELEETFAIVVANLTAPLILEMASVLVRRVCRGGLLLVGGILTEQVEGVVDGFRHHHCEAEEIRGMDEWRALLLRRKA